MAQSLQNQLNRRDIVYNSSRSVGRFILPPIVATRAYIINAFYYQFLTRRTPEQPGAVIWALASDGQYYIPVKFATNALNEFRYVAVSQQTSHRIDSASLLAH